MDDLPKYLQQCEACGHQPEPEKRLHYLAGCLDDHRVAMQFDIYSMQQRVAHAWPDNTYSALTFLDEIDVDDALLLEWLDACHAGRTERRSREEGVMIEVDRIIATRHVDMETGCVTVTYRLPLLSDAQP